MAGAEQQNLREYLLGQLTEAEEEQVELRLLTEPEFAEEYDIVVDELTDDYVANKFEGAEREQLERHFFKAAERRDKLKFAQALKIHARTLETPTRGVGRSPSYAKNNSFWMFRVAAAMAAVVTIAGVLLLLRQPNQPPQTFTSLTLNVSSGERGEGDQPAVVPLPLNSDALRITLRLPNSPLLETAKRYRVELGSGDGEKKALEPSEHAGQLVTVVIPKAELKRGQFFLKVFAVRVDGTVQPIPGTYLFSVE